MKLSHIAGFSLLSLLSSFSAAELELMEGYVRAMPPGQPNTAAFMLVRNPADKDVKLTSATTSAASTAEFHTHTMDAQGVMRMRAVESVTVAAKGQFEFKPGAYHIMLMGLNKPLTPADTVRLTLTDSEGQQHQLTLPVQSPVEDHGHHGHHHH